MYPTRSRGMHPPMYHRQRSTRLLWPLLWLLLILYVINNPTDAASNTRDLYHWIHTGTNSIATFLDHTRTHP